jgi:hypothetical protein
MNTSTKQKIFLYLGSGLLFAILFALIGYLLGKEFTWETFTFNILFFGFIFGFGFTFLAKRLSRHTLQSIKMELTPGEQILQEAPANLFRGFEGVGGKLLLTNKRLVFKSHKLNIQTGETSLFFEDIEKAIPRNTAKILQNGMRVIDKSGLQFDFVLNDRDNWIAKINTKQMTV